MKYVNAIALALVLTLFSYVIGTSAWLNSIINGGDFWLFTSEIAPLQWTPMFALEVFAVFTSFACTYLCVVQSRANYPIGAVSVAAYSYLFWQAGLFSSAALNLYLVPALLYGWFRWRPDTITRPVTRLKFDAWLVGYGLLIPISYGFILAVTTYFGATLPALDTAILVLTILAQLMLDNKKLENWLVWVVVNLISIYVYWNAGLALVTIQYVFFLMNTVWGFASWYRTYKDSTNGTTSA